MEMASQSYDEKYYKCCKKKCSAIVICINCGGIFHKSCVERIKNVQIIGENRILCCNQNQNITCKYHIEEIEKLKLENNELKVKIKQLEDEVSHKNKEENLDIYSEKVEKLEKQLLMGLQNVRQELQECMNRKGTVRKYSEVVKNNEAVIIVEANKNENNTNIKEELKKKIDPSSLEVGVTMGKTTRNGGLVIRCENNAACEKVKNKIQEEMGQNFNVKMAKKNNPLIKVAGINVEENTEDLVQKIVKQNKLEEHANFVIDLKKKMKPFNYRFNAILEVDGKTFKSILETGKIKIGWSICSVSEYIKVTRCYKCSQYGHIAKYCNNKLTCPKCAEEHESKECKEENSEKCINCIIAKNKYNIDTEINHTAFSQECPCYKRMRAIQARKTDYDCTSI